MQSPFSEKFLNITYLIWFLLYFLYIQGGWKISCSLTLLLTKGSFMCTTDRQMKDKISVQRQHSTFALNFFKYRSRCKNSILIPAVLLECIFISVPSRKSLFLCVGVTYICGSSTGLSHCAIDTVKVNVLCIK